MATKTKTEQEAATAAASSAAAKGKKAPDDATGGWWSSLPEHQRAGYAGLIVTLLAALGVAGLFARTNPSSALAPIGMALYNLCGWSAYPLVMGLLAAGILRIAEGFAHHPLAPRWLPLQMLTLLLVLVAASRLLFGGHAGGLLGQLLALLLSPFPFGLVTGVLIAAAFVLCLAILGVTLDGVVGMGRRLAFGAFRDLEGRRIRGRIPRFEPRPQVRVPERSGTVRPMGPDAHKGASKTAARPDPDGDEDD